MMRSAQYIDLIEKKAIPDMQKAFPDGSGVFQQVLAPCHTSKIVTNFFQNKQDKSVGLAGKLTRFKSDRKFMVYHKDSSPQQGLYNQNQADRGHNSGLVPRRTNTGKLRKFNRLHAQASFTGDRK